LPSEAQDFKENRGLATGLSSTLGRVSRDWEAQLGTWIKPASAAEEQRRDRTVTAVTDAINAIPDIANYPINVYAKGSFANNTNVRLDSDVDINVEFTGLEYFDLGGDLEGFSREEAGIQPAPYEYEPDQLKADIERALVSAFGRGSVSRGNTALTLRERSNQLAADVVPCFSYQDYYGRSNGSLVGRSGVKIFPDKGIPIENWPQQHLDNGKAKNKATGRRFKNMVRALKNLENEMAEKGTAKQVPSYLVECLVYNVPDDKFRGISLKGDLQSVLAHIWNETRTQDDCADWLEVNGIKYLFHATQKWTRHEAHDFADAAWDYVGFET